MGWSAYEIQLQDKIKVSFTDKRAAKKTEEIRKSQKKLGVFLSSNVLRRRKFDTDKA